MPGSASGIAVPFLDVLAHVISSLSASLSEKWSTTLPIHGIVRGHLEHGKGSVNGCCTQHHHSVGVGCAEIRLIGGFALSADLMALAALLAPARDW